MLQGSFVLLHKKVEAPRLSVRGSGPSGDLEMARNPKMAFSRGALKENLRYEDLPSRCRRIGQDSHIGRSHAVTIRVLHQIHRFVSQVQQAFFGA